MPSMRIKPVTSEVYHLYNRGVEKRNVFKGSVDYVRFIHNLFEFNDISSAPAFERRYKASTPNQKNSISITKHKEKIVEILCFCLMPNHYHLLVRQLKDGGISLFMHKLGAGYTNSFNIKYNRVGPLFQGKYKIKHVDKDVYLQHLVCYIHFNPMKFLKTKKDLDQYRWSSHLDYLGNDNFGSVIDKSFGLKMFGGEVGYERFSANWIQDPATSLNFIKPVIIDYD
jgi:putative transposase